MKAALKRLPVLGSRAVLVRRRLQRAWSLFQLRRSARIRPLRLVIGAGGRRSAGWINTDHDTLDLLDEAQWQAYFQPGTVDALLAEHVWEHLHPDQALAAARRCFAYLRPGGYLRLAVPDGFNPDAAYIERVRPGGSGPGARDHKVLYNHLSLAELLGQAGFEVHFLEHFDSRGEFHFKDWSPGDGMIYRSSRFDERNANGALRYTSLIVDARKPAPVQFAR